MKILEKLESIRVCDDDKARRVLNVSSALANITAEEIENGVTIERLAEIGVPVFRYSTQVTIHGNIPDFNPESRPMGYKAVFRNENGSLGVKYVAIDGSKKKLICQACRLAIKPQFHASINSQGLELHYSTTDKESAIAAFRAFPKDLIIGGVYAARGVFGEFYVIADIGAIEDANLWPLIQALYGFESQAALDAAQAKRDADYAARRAEFEKECEQRQVEREKIQAQNKATSLKVLQSTLKPMMQLPKGECSFVSVNDFGEVWLYVVVKKGFGLCYKSIRYGEGVHVGMIDRTKKMKRWADKQPHIAARAAKGQVFAI